MTPFKTHDEFAKYVAVVLEEWMNELVGNVRRKEIVSTGLQSDWFRAITETCRHRHLPIEDQLNEDVVRALLIREICRAYIRAFGDDGSEGATREIGS